MRKAWNIPDVPVYSLATYDSGKVNMNICTYVTKVSMEPNLMGVAVFQHTRTLENISKSDLAVLQLLHEGQWDLVRKLGQASGLNYDKQSYLAKRDLLDNWSGMPVLKNASGLMLLRKKDRMMTGDHELFVFEVLKSISRNTECLYKHVLREKKLIRG